MKLDRYEAGRFYDEMFDGMGQPRAGCALLARTLAAIPDDEVLRRQHAAERALLHMGSTFNVYGHEAGVEKILPFDMIPRIIPASEWRVLERGLAQRARALNLFIDDIYHAQRVIADGIVPRELVETASSYLPACRGLDPPGGVWCHISGTDLVRDSDGRYYVLEDNMRCPSGVSYVLQNRRVMKRTFPRLFEASRVRPVDAYPSHLLQTLQQVRPKDVASPTVVLLTPGVYNSAYFEHSFLAQQMGIELVEGRDLVVRGTRVLISADLMIRGKVAEYAPGAIGDVGQRLVEQFAGNVEQLLATQAGAILASPGPQSPRFDKRLLAASALLLAGGALAAGALAARAAWRRGHTGSSLLPDTPRYFLHEGARHG